MKLGGGALAPRKAESGPLKSRSAFEFYRYDRKLGINELYNRCNSRPALGDTSPNHKTKDAAIAGFGGGAASYS